MAGPGTGSAGVCPGTSHDSVPRNILGQWVREAILLQPFCPQNTLSALSRAPKHCLKVAHQHPLLRGHLQLCWCKAKPSVSAPSRGAAGPC